MAPLFVDDPVRPGAGLLERWQPPAPRLRPLLPAIPKPVTAVYGRPPERFSPPSNLATSSFNIHSVATAWQHSHKRLRQQMEAGEGEGSGPGSGTILSHMIQAYEEYVPP
jgi:hypothetical protein